ncbi:CvpA family protein [Streptococcus iniae]|uniref:Colicin V production protein n=1 Tax=Streptococcus iniae TaxID=1346 RepID=A0A1J0N0T7_STRIN|nr:CvpA family protein [Streptococcus iniae]AGM99577.1 CvpA family protein [Streptococcus iniae SF1]AHY16496.1 colicin V production protein [Streptococcus iniae]AHY18360.1 colicin V production protein [Streptococcus iniae]AJG26644.1 colicin V production protein [Streptococcus iniae]APD32519.1 colicin V production protein [Streptococcus iniae]
MLSILIFLLLLWHFYIGYNRGVLLQAFYFIGSLISLLIASRYYDNWAHKIALWIPYSNPAEGVSIYFFKDLNIFHLDHVYYAGIAFFAIFSLSYAIFRLIGVLVHFLPINYFDDWYYHLAGGLMAVCVTIIFLAMGVSILATVPMPMVQEQLHQHLITRLLIEHCPPITQLIKHFWVNKMI